MVKKDAITVQKERLRGTPKYHLTIADSINILNKEDWNNVLDGQDVYLSTEYLLALEKSMEETMEFRYVIFYCEQYTPLGIAYYQVVDLVDTGSRYADAVRNLGKRIGARIVNELKVRSLVCGNVFHCGEHGFIFKEKISQEQALAITEQTIKRLKQDGEINSKVNITLFKEFWPQSFPVSENLVKKGYHMFRMDMNMVLDLDEAWVDMDSYLGFLTSKARTRVKSIKKKSSSLEIRDMDSAMISEELPSMKRLFQLVLDKSSFTFGELRMETYVGWKQVLGDDLVFQGFYQQGEMVGFLSAFRQNGILDVHYVGLDYDKNEELAIYQRMLIQLLEIAIESGSKKLIYGRTAEQAKSSLGAVPFEMRLYTKHRNAVANKLITPIMKSVEPKSFELRSPFKKI